MNNILKIINASQQNKIEKNLKNKFKKQLVEIKKQLVETKKQEKNIKIQKQQLVKCLKQLTKLPRFNTDGRHIARANETIRIEQLAKLMNENNNTVGKNLRESYEAKFNKKIKNVELAGTNSEHFDLVIHHTDDTKFNIEEKHSDKCLNTTDVPWKLSVQVLNGVGSQFIVGDVLAEMWYNNIIVTTNWNELLNCDDIPNIPSFDEWIKDAFRCGDPKTEFVKSIKRRCRELYGDKSSFTGLNGTPDLRSRLPDFVLNDEQKQLFISQIQNKLTDVLGQKDIFLQTKGDINSDKFEFAWRDNVEPPNITNINIRREKDIFIDLIDNDNNSFTGILRWGKGCGMTNIRFDVR